jgi:RNA polymerase sigma factor (TIGR02999 family)
MTGEELGGPAAGGGAVPAGAAAESYERLRRVAARLLQGERLDHTLQPTALVHEAWLRLAEYRGAQVLQEADFQVLASQVMRHVLTDHARARATAKRDGGERQPLEHADRAAGAAVVLDVDEALRSLAEVDAELATLVELRFFGRHSLPEIAELTGQSLRTVNRRWSLARAWLAEALDAGPRGGRA